MRFGKKLMGGFGMVLGAAAAALVVGCSIAPNDDIGRGSGKLVPDPADDDTCGQSCGGPLDVDCGSKSFCAAASCDAIGTCEPRPQGCPDNWDPVCGCDGNTYGNACDAAASGVGVDHAGECGSSGGACGGPLDVVCPEGSYCVSEDGTCGGLGVCTPVGDPQCPEIYAPVCGCNGKTYDNACFAAAAGIEVASDGACETNDEVCGGFAGIACDDDSYCKYAEGTCGEYDLQGVCEPIAQACPDNWDPVCGCDAQTHGNSCEAAAAGTSIRHHGACDATEEAE